MALSTGTRLGGYEITGALGAGGMGEVYKARDTKLGRDVAIKVIPALFADNPERAARFEREAQLLAALNHPHIAAIYGLEDSPSGRFLVLELVDGESLAQRLETTAPRGFTVPETLRIAGQIIDALEAAHDKGIIHRDLKPANIMLTADGQVKVLDFGLARAMEPDAASSATNSPTLTFAATQAGIILGTAAYMSPEQAKGRVADKRSDVWAFGCVLFEMLTGKRAFEGEDVSDTLAAILRGEPDWTAIPDDVPANLRAIVHRCLLKDRKSRIPEISVVRYLLAEPPAPAPVVVHPPAPQRAPRGRMILVGTIGLLGGAALTGAAWFASRLWAPTETPLQVRFEILPPAGRALTSSTTDRTIAVSPDGTHIAYTGRGSTGEGQLMLRRFDQLDVTPLAGTAAARAPFFSHDGRWIGFFTGNELRKVSVNGGPVMTVCRVTGGTRGGTWTADNRIVYATSESTTGLMIVPAAGGEPVKLTTPEAGRNDHFFPNAVGDRNEILFTIRGIGGSASSQIALLNLTTGEQRPLVPGGSHAEYVQSGHIVFAVDGSLRAVRYDPDRGQVAGDPVPVEQGVTTLSATGAGNYAVSRSGHLLFVPGGAAGDTAKRSLAWVDRQGRQTAIPAAPSSYSYPRVSPDGSRVAIEIREPDVDVWIFDVIRQTAARFTFESGSDGSPMWTPDGRRIIFNSARAGAPNLYWQAADGTGAVERLTTSPNVQVPNAVTRDGARLVFMELAGATGGDLMLLQVDGKSKPEPLLHTQHFEGNADLSPDDRWIAYQTNEAGQPQVWVRPFPAIDSGRWQIAATGSRPRWSPDGREIFYQDGRAIMSVAIETTPSFRAGKPVKLFDMEGAFIALPGRLFDVSPDGRRFLIIKEPPGHDTEAANRMVLVLNWHEELKAKLPLK